MLEFFRNNTCLHMAMLEVAKMYKPNKQDKHMNLCCEDEHPDGKLYPGPNDGLESEARHFEAAIVHAQRMMEALGIDLEDENFRDTPKRFVKYLKEFSQGYEAEEILKASFAHGGTEYHGMIAQTKIPFRGVCAHHLLPFLGEAHVGYIPNNRVVGLSKLSRLVKAVGLSTPSIQETITDKIADHLMDHLEAKGVIVVVSAVHTCMAARGVAVSGVPTTTSSVRGLFRDVPPARDEFFRLMQSTTSLRV